MSPMSRIIAAVVMIALVPSVSFGKKSSKSNSGKISRSSKTDKKRSKKRGGFSPSKKSIGKQVKNFNFGLVYNKKLEKKAKLQIAKISIQLGAAKTVGDWINKAPRKLKLQRRMNFSRYMKQAIPKYAVSEFSILFENPKSKKSPHVFTIFPDKSGLVTSLDGVDISPRKKESFKKWKKRMKWGRGKSRNAFWQFIFPELHAQQNAIKPFYFAEILSIMSNSDWEDFDIQKSLDGDSMLVTQVEAEDLVNRIAFLEEFYQVECSGDGGANLTTGLGTEPEVRVHVHPRLSPNNLSQSIDILRSGGNAGNISIPTNRSSATFTQNGKEYSHESFLPAVRYGASGIDVNGLPEHSPQHGPQPVKPHELVEAHEAVKACQAIKTMGIDDPCSDKLGDSFNYSICIKGVINAGLPGGLFNRSPLKKLTTEDAIALKVQLAHIYNSYPIGFGIGEDYPTVKRAVNTPFRQYNGNVGIPADEITAALSVHLEEDNAFHQAVVNCISNSGNGRGMPRACNDEILRNNPKVAEQIWKLSNHLDRPTVADNFANFYNDFQNIIDPNDSCYTSYVDNNMLFALEEYNKLSVRTGSPSTQSATSMQVRNLSEAADAARAICSNRSLRQKMTPSSGTKSSN